MHSEVCNSYYRASIGHNVFIVQELRASTINMLHHIQASVVTILAQEWSPPKSTVRFELLCPAPNEEWLNVASFPPVEISMHFDCMLDEGDFKEHTQQFEPAAIDTDSQICVKIFEALEKHRKP